jgi:3-oxoacyl-[acyl-carrier-protein] synthase II
VAEVQAIRMALGDAADGLCVSATKSMTGHLLGAAGAVEGILTVLALQHRTAPPTANLENKDDDVHLDVVGATPRELPDGPVLALNNSFGFGGHNVALAFRTVDS